MPGPTAPTTRFAPAPTGYLHLGHVASAIWVWGAACALGGRVLLRIEDHDRGRSRPEYERALLEDLDWLGLTPDDPPVRQSDREALYRSALDRLAAQGLVYPCACSRRDVADTRYAGTCRTRDLDPIEVVARRVRLDREEIVLDDLRLGRRVQVPAEQCGDLLARERAGHWTYPFAVVVDDIEQGIDLVVRGEDLLASTGRQIQLARLLGRARPARFLHHPLILGTDGAKLAKSAGDTGLRELRAAGWSARRVLGTAAHAVGLVERAEPLGVADVAERIARGLAV
jgi:glutamyl-tRNA synthetase/glutamyl-Q tRNA(Asp) synthetase